MRFLTDLSRFRISVESALLLLIVVVALALRLHGLNWDAGYGFHPDERSLYMRAGCMYDLLTERPGYQDCIVEHPQIEPGWPGFDTLLDFDRSPLNPHWFPLGSVLIYLLVGFRWVIELFTDISALDMRYVGRSLSALADVGSVLLVYVLGRRIYGRTYGVWVGLLAASLLALAVISVQHSHFYRPETFSALLVLAVFWAMLQVLEKGRLRDSAILGLLVGLAFAPKVSILPLALPLALTYYFLLAGAGSGGLAALPRGALERVALHCLLALAVALTAFFLVTPYALLDLRNFLGEQLAQTEMARNAGLWPFTIQYVGTPPFFYQFQQTGVWGLGPLLGVSAWLAVAFTGFLVWQGAAVRRADLLILAWVIPGILFLESFEVRFQRYYFALTPFMVLLAARMLLWLPFYLAARVRNRASRVSRLSFVQAGIETMEPTAPTNRVKAWWDYLRFDPAGRRYLMVAAWALPVLVVATTAFYSLAFQRVYSQPHPAVAASQWLKERAPAGTAIVSDNHWDEFLPELYPYQVWQFPAYEPDNVGKMAELSQRLADSEYLVFYSHRPYVSVASDPQRFPLTNEYYRRLFAGELGYRLERSFTSYPGFLGIEIADDPWARTEFVRPEPAEVGESAPITLNWGYADDNVVGYDHPTTLVFHNVDRLPVETLLAALVAVQDEPITRLKLTEEERIRQQAGGTWSALFNRNSAANRLPALAWLLVVEFIYLLALPLCLYLFRPLADRGILLARIVGLFVVAYLTWLVVSLGWIEFSNAAIWLAVLGLAGLSGLTVILFRDRMVEFIMEKWRLLLAGEVLFLAAFLAFALIRAWNPDLWHPFRGGEKPMELAYFNAVIRSTLLPPYDPWFAGGYLNYYYWGYFLLAIPTRLAGVVPTVAFNLATPLLFALTVTGAASVVYNLAEGVRRSRRPARSLAAEVTDVEADSDYAGDYGDGMLREHSRVEAVIRSPLTAGLTAALFVAVIGNLDGLLQLGQGVWGKLFGDGGAILPFDFWRSSRMLPNLDSVEPGPLHFWLWHTADQAAEVSWHITEFPFFSFLFADLHAHMMAIPFMALAVALALNLTVGLRRIGWAWDAVAVTAAGLAVGSLWLINSWDYPSFLLLVMAGAALTSLTAWDGFRARLAWALGLALAIGVVSVLAFLPFHQSVETFDTGLEVSRWQTPPLNFLGIYGMFLLIVGCFLAWQARRPLYIIAGGSLGLKYLDMAVQTDTRRLFYRRWLRLFTVLGLLVALFFVAAGYYTVAFLLVLLLLAGLVFWDGLMSNDRGQGYALFPLTLLALALGLAAGVELVRVENDIGRMNTLFKYYLEVWVLLGLAAAFCLWRMWYDNLFRPVELRGSRLLWVGLVALLLLSSLLYTVFGTQARMADRFNDLPPTLDGTAYMEASVHWEQEQPIELKWDLEAVRWLQDNVAGSPVILEAHTEQYRWGGRMANYTGLPTVLGWPWHQIQQRGPYSVEVHERAEDIRQIYETEDLNSAQVLLSKYDVSFVVVGDLERIYYPGAGPEKFDRMVEQGAAAKVFDNGRTAIYLVGRAMAAAR